MCPAEQVGGSTAGEPSLPSVAEHPERTALPARPHLVVVTTRALDAQQAASAGAVLRTRFWHPRDRRWSENDFDSLEHALRLFVDESGWVLRQDQALDAPLARELIFEAHRVDFTRPSREQILRDIGMTPESVDRMLNQVERPQREE